MNKKFNREILARTPDDNSKKAGEMHVRLAIGKHNVMTVVVMIKVSLKVNTVIWILKFRAVYT